MEYQLQEMFQKQHELMERLNLVAHTNKELMLMDELDEKILTRETVVLTFALQDELHEFIRELNWKPWKHSRQKVEIDRVQRELIDAWHFLIELSLMWGLDAKSVYEVYMNKNKENHQRQNGGY